MKDMTLDIAVMSEDTEINRIERYPNTHDGTEFVFYHCRPYELKGWAFWERYIDIDDPLPNEFLCRN